MQQKIKRLKTYIGGLDALISDPNKMLGDKDWAFFFQSNSDLLCNEISLLNNFIDPHSDVCIKFLYRFYEFFEIFKYRDFDPIMIFKYFPDLLSYARKNPHKGMEPFLQEMALYMKKTLMPILQQWKELSHSSDGPSYHS